MTPPKIDAGYVRMPEDEFEAMLARAAEQGARRALADVGLDGPEAAIDIHDLPEYRRQGRAQNRPCRGVRGNCA